MPCNPPKTNADKMWPHEHYYFGERDEHQRKHGEGELHWSGAESLESYQGSMLRDTMHGTGDYRWRYLGPDHEASTYEGKFYNNRMHGYGMMSFPNGRVFNGLWHKNNRWGPGVVSHACLCEDVGFWYGYQLFRLTWRPAVPSVAIDLMSNSTGFKVVAPHRKLLTTNNKIIGEVNSALELLKQCGSEPLAAADKWTKLYATHCTDTTSQLCHVEAFDRAYYVNQIKLLDDVDSLPEKQNYSQSSKESVTDDKSYYYAWNNNKIIIHMMKHCYTHEDQREQARVNLGNILSGPRSSFKQAGKHELDCRTLLMAGYLGHISNVAQLINECDVIPDVTDIQGNSVIMYAACGDQPEVIHFLVEAGAEIDACNDACCTPLCVTLLRYALEKHDVAYNAMLQALLPPSSSSTPELPTPDERILEWLLPRELETSSVQKTVSKTKQVPLSKKPSTKEMAISRKKSDIIPKIEIKIPQPDPSTSKDGEDKRIYESINTEYLIKVAEAYSELSDANPIPYIFEVYDMNKDIALLNEEEQKKATDKTTKPKPNTSKIIKDTTRPSRDMTWQDKEDTYIDTREQLKEEKMNRIMSTILRLLLEGADPRNVRCPQSALFIAIAAGSADLIRHLSKHGVDINEAYPQAYGYTNIDVAVSKPLTEENLEVIRALLECGANPNHRLQGPEPPPTPPGLPSPEIRMNEGPTLLHALLARKFENGADTNFLENALELLLEHGCDPIAQYNGHSAVDLAMNKSIGLFAIFIKNPRSDLNAIINSSNQTMLVKMFYLPFCRTVPITERLQTLTSLLLFGADPLIKCKNGDDEYGNLFVFISKSLNEMETTSRKPSPIGVVKKSKNEIKEKKEAVPPQKLPVPVGAKIATKVAEDNPADYRQALALVIECARLLYIRWLQATLMKNLINVVYKFKHRPWNMILKEHENKNTTSLWLSVVRCLEIWDILKTTKKKIYHDEIILKKVLCIVHFYNKRIRKELKNSALTAPDKELIEREVKKFTHEHKLTALSNPDIVPAIRPYVTPELTEKNVEKFNICFECIKPLTDRIPCDSCNLVSFCSFVCMKSNIGRVNGHPCCDYLKKKYFPTPEETESEENDSRA